MKRWSFLIAIALALFHRLLYAQSPTRPPLHNNLEFKISSAPSTEAWIGAAIGLKHAKHTWSVGVLFDERRPPHSNWTLFGNAESSASLAFTLGHRYRFWQHNRWSIYSHSMMQIQRINVHEGLTVNGIVTPFVRAYPRFQASTGLGLEMVFFKRFYLFQSVRYGIAVGNFYPYRPVIEKYRLGIGADLSLGVRL